MGLAAPVVAPVAGFPFIEPVDLGTGWQMNGLTSGYVRISPPAVSPSVDYTFPVVAPTVGQILSAAAPVAGVSVLSWTTVASTPPAGSGTEIQIRNGSAFGALTGSSFAGGVATLPTLAVTDLTSGRIPFASTLGRIVDSAGLAWNSGTGTLSATNVSGSLTGNVAGNLTGNVTGLVNTVNITTSGSASAFLNGVGSYAVVAYSGLSGTPSTFAPSAHASSHMSAGGDAIRIDELKAPTDVATLDVSITTHGLAPKLPNDVTKFLNGIGTYTVPSGGVTDHGLLTGLADDDHAQYPLLLGRSTNQTQIGATSSGGTYTIQSTSHATKGKILIGTSAYDEVNNRLGIGNAAPSFHLDVGAGGTGTNVAIVRVNAGSGSLGEPVFLFSRNSVIKGYFGVAGASDSIINGSANDDFCVRHLQRILFSADGGTTPHLAISATGLVGINKPTSIAAQLHVSSAVTTTPTCSLDSMASQTVSILKLQQGATPGANQNFFSCTSSGGAEGDKFKITKDGLIGGGIQRAKASYNNWVALSDVVNALVATGLFDVA